MLPYTFFADRAEIERRRDNPEYIESTGMAPAELRAACDEIEADESLSRNVRTAKQLAYLFDHARLEISPRDLFADRIAAGGIIGDLRGRRRKLYRETYPADLGETDIGHETGAYTGDDDFGHTCPDWHSILDLGVPGVIARAEAALAGAAEENRAFYESCVIAWQAFRRLILRFAAAEDAFAGEYPTAKLTADCFRAIADRPPETLHEALLLIVLVYRVQTHIEGIPVRSLGRLDVLTAPFIGKDPEEDAEILRYFLDRMNDRFISANIPFTLGGVDVAENQAVLDASLKILSIYGSLDIISPKIQIRVGENAPAALVKLVCELIRGGSNSLVFCNDGAVVAALEKNGHTPEDAMNYVMIGCYESSTMGREAACTCNGRVILPMAVECAMNGGRTMTGEKQVGPECAEDFASFDEFFAEVKHQAAHFAVQSMRRTAAMERCYPEVGQAPFFSGSMRCCIDSGKDVYAGGVVYNFSSLNAFGIATAADSLAAIRKLVWEDGTLTFAELRELLKSNWEGNERLRLIAKKKFPKYGNGDATVDAIAKELLDSTARVVNGYPNGRGGSFRAGAFSIDWRYPFGAKCAASADGRLAGEVLSKNMCPTDGCDRDGVTAMIESACCFDYTELSNGTVLDMVLHTSAVVGDDGLKALIGLVKTFIAKGGLALQINVLDPAVLRKAQEQPEKYPNLQVRLCGWNVLFVNLKKADQDEFIRWSEK